MPDQPIPLMPDDEPPRPVLLDDDDKPEPWQPYAYLAAYAGLLVLMVLRIVGNMEMLFRLNMAVIAMLAVYLAFVLLRPRVNLLWTCVAGALLGAWYGLPATLLYVDAWRSIEGFATLLAYSVLAGVTGLLLGYFLDAKDEPKLVVPLSFLFVFVAANLYTLIFPLIQMHRTP